MKTRLVTMATMKEKDYSDLLRDWVAEQVQRFEQTIRAA